MKATCVRCNRPGFAGLDVAVTIGATRLEVCEEAGQTAFCAVCVSELAEWFVHGDHAGRKAVLGGGLGNGPASSGESLW